MIRGRAWIFGDDVDTDVIVPGKYLRTKDTSLWAQHVMEGLDPKFAAKVRKGDVSCGGAKLRLRLFARAGAAGLEGGRRGRGRGQILCPYIFRNAINVGLPLVEAVVDCQPGDMVEVDPAAGTR